MKQIVRHNNFLAISMDGKKVPNAKKERHDAKEICDANYVLKKSELDFKRF